VVTQETRVFKGFDGARGEALRAALAATLPADADWRPTPHARFSVRTGEVVVTCYTSGKLVLQGRDLDGFLARHLPELAGAGAVAAAAADILPMAGVTLGSDEVGKGDFFGPLVVAAACVAPAQEERLRAAGITDSKRLGDGRIRLLAGMLEREVSHEFSLLMPELYNQAHARAGNVNLLLADMHARALSRLHARCPAAEAIVVDRFVAGDTLERALRRDLPGHPPLLQVTQGERHVAVASASILARAKFLDGLAECEQECGTELQKGAGAAVDAAARRVVAIGGRALLAKVAKLHFKNSTRL
jgi:ribonuclease HIII